MGIITKEVVWGKDDPLERVARHAEGTRIPKRRLKTKAELAADAKRLLGINPAEQRQRKPTLNRNTSPGDKGDSL